MVVVVLFCVLASGACKNLLDNGQTTKTKGTLESETLSSFQQTALDAIHYSVNFVNTAKRGYNLVTAGFQVSHEDLAKVVVGLSEVRMNSTSIVANLESSHTQILAAFDTASLELVGVDDKVKVYLKEGKYLAEELVLDLDRDYLPELAYTVENIMKTPTDYISKINEAYNNASAATQTIRSNLASAKEMLEVKTQEMRAKVENARSQLLLGVVLPIGTTVVNAIGQIEGALDKVEGTDEDFLARNGSISAIRKSINAVFGVVDDVIDGIEGYKTIKDFGYDADKAESLLSNMDRISANAQKVNGLLNKQVESISKHENTINANIKDETPKIEKVDAEYEEVSDADMKVFAEWLTDKFVVQISKQLKKFAAKLQKPNFSEI